MAYDYENQGEEEPTDEARTNEEAYEELQQQLSYLKFQEQEQKMLKEQLKAAGNGNCVFFNEEYDDDEDDEEEDQQDRAYSSQDEEEEEEGEFDPSLIAGDNIGLIGGQTEEDEDY